MSNWMLRGDLPPVGNFMIRGGPAPPPEFAGYRAYWLTSGTAALALALASARHARPEVRNPHVVLPAYGCPDIVSAAIFAGVRPLLVDIGSKDPSYDAAALSAALRPDVVAVVAVNFLGVRENLESLRNALRAAPGTRLIEDNAQWYPESTTLQGDFVCLSFGRGKPVSLLGGGALLLKDGMQLAPGLIGAASPPSYSHGLRRLAYNFLLHRRAYWLANRNPLLSMGETRLKSLGGVNALCPETVAVISANVRSYLARHRTIESAWRDALSGCRAVMPLDIPDERRMRMLRWPVLCADPGRRDEWIRRLTRAGLGATALYKKRLVEIEGVRELVTEADEGAGAREFAARLLTLPVHAQVTRDDVAIAADILA